MWINKNKTTSVYVIRRIKRHNTVLHVLQGVEEQQSKGIWERGESMVIYTSLTLNKRTLFPNLHTTSTTVCVI